nr:uncharacterized protein LOC109168298 [Ipomoea batatas]
MFVLANSEINFKRSLICLSVLSKCIKRKMVCSLMRGQRESLKKYKHTMMLQRKKLKGQLSHKI